MNMKMVNKGDVYYADLDPAIGSEQNGKRPVVILQNNIGNKYSPTTVIAPITKIENNKHNIPTHIKIIKNSFIKNDSIILIEQIRTIDKKRLIKYLGKLNNNIIAKINIALKKEFSIKENK